MSVMHEQMCHLPLFRVDYSRFLFASLNSDNELQLDRAEWNDRDLK
jgi:hypothetical protein